MRLISELQRRNVFRVGIAYALSSWVLLQVVDVVAPILELPAWAPKLVLFVLAVFLVPALIFAWVFEITPDGLRREVEGEAAPASARTTASPVAAIPSNWSTEPPVRVIRPLRRRCVKKSFSPCCPTSSSRTATVGRTKSPGVGP